MKPSARFSRSQSVPRHWILASILSAMTTLGFAQTPVPANQVQPSTPVRKAVTLHSHHWRLQQAFNHQNQRSTAWVLPTDTDTRHPRVIELRFMENSLLTVAPLCNVMNGHYVAEGQQLLISPLTSTMMACANRDLMTLERRVATQLSLAHQWRIQPSSPPVLELRFDDGQRWLLQGRPTHETLYGASQRVFLEIAAKPVPCDPASASQSDQCLQVREVQYDTQGLKTGTGPWFTLADEIEGFHHQLGVRNVVRLKRYQVPQKEDPATTLSLYVHDLTVESEIVNVPPKDMH